MAKHEMMQFFTYEHLRPDLRGVSRPFCELAAKIVTMQKDERQELIELIAAHQVTIFSHLTGWAEGALGCNSEATWAVVKVSEASDLFAKYENVGPALRKLLEAKDCAVRALLFKQEA